MVRKLLLIGLTLSLVGTARMAWGVEKLDAITWHGVQNYDVPALRKVVDLQVGKVVGVRCHFRGKRMRRIRASWYDATLWEHNPQDRRKSFAYIPVRVARKDVPAFETLPDDFRGDPAVIVYGEVQRGPDSAYVRLIGTKVTRDSARNAIVSW